MMMTQKRKYLDKLLKMVQKWGGVLLVSKIRVNSAIMFDNER